MNIYLPSHKGRGLLTWQYWWDDPYLYKEGSDGLMRRCVSGAEARNIMWHCHSSAYGGHHSGNRTTIKILHCGFWWPTLFQESNQFVRNCDRYQRTGHRFPPSDNKLYILVCVDYVTKCVEALACPANNAHTVINILKKNVFD
ncbi:protein NYNRIN-like, partial [Trifolium medium]|nr:protein NYNRIN-like [Trifolium medium]